MAAIETFRSTHDATGRLEVDIKDLIIDLLHLARRECGIEDVAHFASTAADLAMIETEEGPEE